MKQSTARSRKRERPSRESCRPDTPSHSLSLTRPRVTYVPPPAPTLWNIPPSPVGLIDTLRIVIGRRCMKSDLDALCARTDFKVVECDGSREMENGRTVRTFGRRVALHRKSDGCRIWIRDEKIEVEVSLPRVLGLYNDEQDQMSEDDVLPAVRMATSGLFPKTTLRGKFSTRRRFWHVTRIDIAVNLPGRILEYVEAYRHARRPRSKTKPEVYSDCGVAWYGKDYALLIYDPGQRLPRGRLKNSLSRSKFCTGPKRVRVELRFQGPRAIKQLLKHFGQDSRGLPFLVSGSDGEPRVQRFGLDHHRLHQILATELRGLGDGLRTRTVTGNQVSLIRRLAHAHLIEHPEKWAEVESECSPRTVRKLKQETTALEIDEKDINLVERAWNRPRVNPRLRHRLVELVRSWELAPPDTLAS